MCLKSMSTIGRYCRKGYKEIGYIQCDWQGVFQIGRMLLVSIMRETRPDGLFQYLEKHGYSMSDPYKGIYYIEGNVLFPAQIVVTGELDEESHIGLKTLSERLKEDDIRNLLEGVNKLTEKMDKEGKGYVRK